MASGWANDGAVQEQIDSTIEDAIARARSQLPRGEPDPLRRVRRDYPEARRRAIPGVRLCVNCQAEHDREQAKFSGYNRRGSKDSQLR